MSESTRTTHNFDADDIFAIRETNEIPGDLVGARRAGYDYAHEHWERYLLTALGIRSPEWRFLVRHQEKRPLDRLAREPSPGVLGGATLPHVAR